VSWRYVSASSGSGVGHGRHLWEFIRDLLQDTDDGDKLTGDIVRWENRAEGIFRIVDSKRVAQLWGIRKRNQTMTYEKLSRALRSVTDAVVQNNYLLIKTGVTVIKRNQVCFSRSSPIQSNLDFHNLHMQSNP